MYRLRFSKSYRWDVDSSYNYINEKLEAPMAADNLINEIVKKLEKLKENPYTRPLVQNKYLATKGIRSINVKNYILIYKINEENKTVLLYRFLYSRRDWENLLIDELEE